MAKGMKNGERNTMDVQIATLKAELTPKEIKEATMLANRNPSMVKLAFKLIPKFGEKIDGLTKREHRYFCCLQRQSPRLAAEYKSLAPRIRGCNA